MSMTSYFHEAFRVLEAIRSSEAEALSRVAGWFADAIRADRLIYTFGTGHSSLLAAEGLYRAGGLANVSAILEPTTTFAGGAVAGSALERTSGLADTLLARYPLTAGDLLVVFSNSGANALPVEAAEAAAARGARTVAVCSRAYAARAPATAAGGRTLPQVCDAVIDNHVPPGDAVVAFEAGSDAGAAASLSTVAGAFVWNALVAEAVARVSDAGARPPVYVSSNMPGAAATNRELVARFRPRVRHL